MSSRRFVLCVVTGYLLLTSLVVLLWLGSRAGGMPSAWAVLLGLAPAVLYPVVALPVRERSEFLGRSTACLGFLPVLLLMWASASADDLARASTTGAQTDSTTQVQAGGAPQAADHDLDPVRLFAGAFAQSDVPLQVGGVILVRRAAFADGSELTLYRFESAVHAGAYANFLAGTRGGVPAELERRQVTRLSPQEERHVYIGQHGRELLQVDAQDAAQALSRLTQQDVPTPEPGSSGTLLAQTAVEGRTRTAAEAAVTAPQWPFMLAASIVHILAFVGFIFWVGSHSTRVAPAENVQRVTRGRLRARLKSLEGLGVPFSFGDVTSGNELALQYRFDPESGRQHQVFLDIDDQRGEVRVRERTNARGAAPRNERERDMRSLGERRFDPTRPDAQKVWSRVVQTSILEPEQLAAVPVTLREDRVELPPDYAQSIDTDRMIYLLCAVVTRSGYVWQPVFMK